MSHHIVIAGNLAQDPDAGISDAGVSWTRLTVITNDRQRDRNHKWTSGTGVRYCGSGSSGSIQLVEHLPPGLQLVPSSPAQRPQRARVLVVFAQRPPPVAIGAQGVGEHLGVQPIAAGVSKLAAELDQILVLLAAAGAAPQPRPGRRGVGDDPCRRSRPGRCPHTRSVVRAGERHPAVARAGFSPPG